MNLKILVILVMLSVLLIEMGTSVYPVKQQINSEYGKNKSYEENFNYEDFIQYFYPSDRFCIMMTFYSTNNINKTPYSKVTISAGESYTVNLEVTKINMSFHPDFYLRAILVNGGWTPLNRPTENTMNLMGNLKKYNEWLNTSLPLTKNEYNIRAKILHFSANSTTMSENITFAINNWDSRWGLVVLVRPANGSLWVPVESLAIKVVHTANINDFLHIIYLITTSALLIIVNVVIRLRIKVLRHIRK